MNVLGRDITAKVANLRQVNWRSLGINFVMVFSPNTLKSAPHSHIVTVEMEGGDEAAPAQQDGARLSVGDGGARQGCARPS